MWISPVATHGTAGNNPAPIGKETSMKQLRGHLQLQTLPVTALLILDFSKVQENLCYSVTVRQFQLIPVRTLHRGDLYNLEVTWKSRFYLFFAVCARQAAFIETDEPPSLIGGPFCKSTSPAPRFCDDTWMYEHDTKWMQLMTLLLIDVYCHLLRLHFNTNEP